MNNTKFKSGDKVMFCKSSLESGMIDAKEDDVFTVKESYKRAVTLKELQGCYHVTHFEHANGEIMNNTEEQEIKWEIGQEVWDVARGKGIITAVYPGKQVQVGFEGSNYGGWYHPNGAYQAMQWDNNKRTLFFSEPQIIAEKFPPKKPFVPTFKQGETVVAKKKDGKNTVVFYVNKETELSVESTGCGYPKALYNFYKIGEEVKFS